MLKLEVDAFLALIYLHFGSIIYCYKDICKSFAYANLSFVNRQANGSL